MGEHEGREQQGEPRFSGGSVDVWDLARLRRTLRGKVALRGLSRLLDGLPAQPDREVDWQLAGETDSLGRRHLTLRAHAVVTLECQRCLGPLDLPLDVENRLQLVETEAELETEEQVDDDPDAPDCVAGSAHFDALSLVEDELILALPYVPKHEVCPSLPKPLEAAEDNDTGRPSPFAVLAELKKD
ncbi:DUF177 domain-containing protein [Alcaligenaceae bacterium]|nr:DUF177 domain-containing protein [Alcaligenaceae bacterium]